jgi:hypothetical protein
LMPLLVRENRFLMAALKMTCSVREKVGAW